MTVQAAGLARQPPGVGVGAEAELWLHLATRACSYILPEEALFIIYTEITVGQQCLLAGPPRSCCKGSLLSRAVVLTLCFRITWRVC